MNFVQDCDSKTFVPETISQSMSFDNHYNVNNFGKLFPKCWTCRKSFLAKTFRTPHMLPCGHSICEMCVLQFQCVLKTSPCCHHIIGKNYSFPVNLEMLQIITKTSNPPTLFWIGLPQDEKTRVGTHFSDAVPKKSAMTPKYCQDEMGPPPQKRAKTMSFSN